MLRLAAYKVELQIEIVLGPTNTYLGVGASSMAAGCTLISGQPLLRQGFIHEISRCVIPRYLISSLVATPQLQLSGHGPPCFD